MKQQGIIIAFILSACMHVVGFGAFSLYTNAKGAPVIYFWPNIIDSVDVENRKRDVHMPESAMLSTQQLTRDYFFTPGSLPRADVFARPDHYPSSASPADIDNTTAYMYLWEKSTSDSSVSQEQVSYKALVSPTGKIIFLFPQKLPVNSFANLLREEYTRESVLFLNDKFSWTKIEAVVQ